MLEPSIERNGDQQTGHRTPVEQRLRDEAIVWLSTTRPDGRPHVVPTWFVWDGRSIMAFSKPHAQKIRNLRSNPAVMLAVGEPDEDMDVELIEGRATVLEEPTALVAPEELFRKYGALMARAALDRRTYEETYSQAVSIVPTRFLGWGGKGWTEPGASGDDVTGHGMFGLQGSAREAAAALREAAATARGRDPAELLEIDD